MLSYSYKLMSNVAFVYGMPAKITGQSEVERNCVASDCMGYFPTSSDPQGK